MRSRLGFSFFGATGYIGCRLDLSLNTRITLWLGVIGLSFGVSYVFDTPVYQTGRPDPRMAASLLIEHVRARVAQESHATTGYATLIFETDDGSRTRCNYRYLTR